MKKVWILLKKDITLDKAYLFTNFALSIGMPVFVAKTFLDIGLKEGIDFASLFLSTFYCMFMLLGKIGIIEGKCKVTSYLAFTPVTRKQVVFSKYLLSAFIFLCCVIGYDISHLAAKIVPALSFSAVAAAIFINVLVMGIYIPMEFKIGYENARYYLMVLIVGGPLIIAGMGRYKNGLILSGISLWAVRLKPYCIGISIILLIISCAISIYVYENKDL